MSRNKDKHEGASGRTYHIMSEAERASGRRGGWTTLEVNYYYYILYHYYIKETPAQGIYLVNTEYHIDVERPRVW